MIKSSPRKWLRTYYNKEKGVRYCIWLAPSEKNLEKIFEKFDVSFETIVEIEETVPELWGGRDGKNILPQKLKPILCVSDISLKKRQGH
jgi:hypothetical protein